MGFESCGPNEVLVVSGAGLSRSKFKIGGWVFVWPKLQQVQRLSLNLMTLALETQNAHTHQGIVISVKATAQVRVCSRVEEVLRCAAETFLGKSEEEIGNIIKVTLESHQRTIISRMSLEDVYFDRDKKFQQTVYEEASTDLINMGIQVVSYEVKEVTDNEGQVQALAGKQGKEKSRGAER